MPQKYRVTLSDGRVMDVTTEGGPPDEASILASLSASPSAPTPAEPKPPTAADQFRNAPVLLGGMSLNQAAKLARRLPGMAVDALPAIGGTVGAMAGVPLGPAGAVAGAGMGGALGYAMKGGIDTATGRAAPVGVKTAIADTATAGATQAALEGAGQAVVAGAGPIAQRLYRGYLKPSLSARAVGKADTIVQTALDEALPITRETPGRVRSLVSQLKAQVRTITDNSTEVGDLTSIANQLRDWGKAKFLRPGASSADYDAVLSVADRIDKHAGLVGNPARQPLSVLQDTKEALQESARSGYGVKSGAETTAEKVGASYTRNAIEQAAPMTGPLNERMAKLIDAAKAIEKATGREHNQYINYGTKAMVGAAVGGEEYHRTGNPFVATAEALGATLALQPGVMSRVAIVASRLGKIPGTSPGMAARAAIQAVLAANQGDDKTTNDPQGK